ncbi:alpha/beta fold hydrolase [Saccharothrix variisporea]|uniref:Pimeloyl-ACP methyl ester carboxylesterase n=1 Tax=Saccharothrix variisporea TaxID=543527 RepID=A0A495XKK1_9PSEU|nr:alpha/beta hydrolase [Saccharothrix variisporea]RKT75000.1 pimeloyl-ACP methyl ester carboxylesterase [Saccharothrix variisporea]
MSHEGIHVHQDGPTDAPALLLIHGTGASARYWDPMVPLLTGAHHVIRIDLLGCGSSPVPEDGNYAVPHQARLVGAALDRLGVTHVTAVGHSSGGAFATALAETHPDLVTALVLINTGPDLSAYTATDVPFPATPWDELTDDQIRQAISGAFAPGFEIPQTLVDQFRTTDLAVFGQISQAFRSYLDELPLPPRLTPLGKPLLVLFGEQDRRWRPSSAGDYLTVSGATVTMLPDVGHSPNVESPSRTAAHLLAFTTALRGE